MPRTGRPPNSPAEHKLNRTKPRKPAPKTVPAPAATLTPPASVVELGLSKVWHTHVADLTRGYVLTETNALRLEGAMKQYANFLRWSARLDEIFEQPEFSESDKTKVQGNINSSLTSYNTTIDGIEKSVRNTPAPDGGPSIEDHLLG